MCCSGSILESPSDLNYLYYPRLVSVGSFLFDSLILWRHIFFTFQKEMDTRQPLFLTDYHEMRFGDEGGGGELRFCLSCGTLLGLFDQDFQRKNLDTDCCTKDKKIYVLQQRSPEATTTRLYSLPTLFHSSKLNKIKKSQV